MEFTFIGLFVGFVVGGLFATFREENKKERENDKVRNELRFFWKRRDPKESTHMIIMDAIACGLDIHEVIKKKGNSTWIYQYWYSYRNQGYFYNENWSDSRDWVGGKKGVLKKNKKNTSVPLMFRASEIPLEKYKHLKPGSGKDFGRMDLMSINTQSFSVKDLKE